MTDAVRLDLHVHSAHSPDSRLSLDRIANQVPYVGLRGFALTDHNSVAGHREIPEVLARHPGLLILPGVEVSALEGHLLAYGVSEVPPVRRPVAETIEWVRRHGGEAALAHPFRISHGVGRAVAESAPRGPIEVCNGHSSAVANAKAELLAARLTRPGTGGSDVHEIADLGRAYTEFSPEVRTVDDLLEALRTGKVEAGGQSLRWRGRLRLTLRTTARRVARGFRPI